MQCQAHALSPSGAFPLWSGLFLKCINRCLGGECVKKSAAVGCSYPSPGRRSFLSATPKGTKKVAERAPGLPWLALRLHGRRTRALTHTQTAPPLAPDAAPSSRPNPQWGFSLVERSISQTYKLSPHFLQGFEKNLPIPCVFYYLFFYKIRWKQAYTHRISWNLPFLRGNRTMIYTASTD